MMRNKSLILAIILAFSLITAAGATPICYDVAGTAVVGPSYEDPSRPGVWITDSVTLSGSMTIDNPFINPDMSVVDHYIPSSDLYGIMTITAFDVSIGDQYSWSGDHGELAFEYHQPYIFADYWHSMDGTLTDNDTQVATSLNLIGITGFYLFGDDLVGQSSFTDVSQIGSPYGINISFRTYGDQLRAIDMSLTQAAAPVPEPATLLLFGTGIAGLFGYRRRFAKNRRDV